MALSQEHMLTKIAIGMEREEEKEMKQTSIGTSAQQAYWHWA